MRVAVFAIALTGLTIAQDLGLKAKNRVRECVQGVPMGRGVAPDLFLRSLARQIRRIGTFR